ncbi:MAG: hypothetical protein DHS20C01_15070 [marine bacterium B5-7]|nr:MAG: hypothetical protein DHS20C01_15070 [marine bacterium B5-7]
MKHILSVIVVAILAIGAYLHLSSRGLLISVEHGTVPTGKYKDFANMTCRYFYGTGTFSKIFLFLPDKRYSVAFDFPIDETIFKPACPRTYSFGE